ncbi:MAG: hypothetical protein V4738_14365 [Pseudomonadota bacterium]
MTMAANGIAKLIEECGELQQILGKKLAYYTTDEHPDGAGSLTHRLEDEMGDVYAAMDLIRGTLDLDGAAINQRRDEKLRIFQLWHAASDNNQHAIDYCIKADSAALKEMP